MAGFRTEIDVGQFGRFVKDIDKRQLPFAVSKALNATAFLIRKDWQAEMPRVFDRPERLTVNAVLFKKSTKTKLFADVFIRDEATKGTPPSKYLLPEAEGGQRRQKGFERALSSKNPRARRFYVPGRGLKSTLDKSGNVPRRIYGKILSQLQARGGDQSQNESVRKRASRLRRGRKKGGGGSFFILPVNRGRLKAGVIYERIGTGFGSAVRSVLFPVDQPPRYRVRFNARAITLRSYNKHFPLELRKSVELALRTARR